MTLLCAGADMFGSLGDNGVCLKLGDIYLVTNLETIVHINISKIKLHVPKTV